MSVDGWNTVLVLGGIRSGKSEFAESLVADVPAVRYVATSAAADPDDPQWAARIERHRERRPGGWTTEETAADPAQLARVFAEARPNETLLVDDLGGWVSVLLNPIHQPADDLATIAELVAAVRDCPARLVLVSPEVGLSLVPTTPLGRAFADALGATNRAVADVCDAVILVVAGQPTWLKPGAPMRAASVPSHAEPSLVEGVPGTGTTPSRAPGTAGPAPAAAGTAAGPQTAQPSGAAPATWSAPTMALPMIATGLVIQPGMDLPMPDEYAGPQALDRLAALDVPGAGLGVLERAVGFAAATQGTPTPAPWGAVRVLLLHGDHTGGAAAGTVPGESARRAGQARAGTGPLARLAAECGADLQVVDAPTAAPIEEGPALTAEAVESALRHGWRLAEEAAGAGMKLLVIGACGTGAETAAAAVLTATAGAEAPAVLARVVAPGGHVDDNAWMIRCAAVRDSLRRIRNSSRTAKEILAELGGGDIAIATGVLLGAAARRLPVLLDGPVGLAAGLISRDLAGQARHWCLLPDHGGHPAVSLAADVLGLTPLLDLRLDLGEGANALAALPLLRSVIALAAALPVHPGLAGPGPDSPDGGPDGGPDAGRDAGRDGGPDAGVEPDFEEEPDFTEPDPIGPGPATTDTAGPATTAGPDGSTGVDAARRVG